MMEDAQVECPYCGEPFEVVIDCTAGSQDYFEDCPVCCKPIRYLVGVDDNAGLAALNLLRDDE